MRNRRFLLPIFWLALAASPAAADESVLLGPRPFDILNDMDEGPLKRELQKCTEGPFRRSDFSIAHRGAPLEFPEHTRESYEAAARMGAGIIECDVTFTKDRELVCRHAQCDLHTTTNILQIPDLAAKCSAPNRCCASDLTLAEFKRLRGTKRGSEVTGTVMSHAESIRLFQSLGAKFTPELKEPEVAMPFEGTYTRQHYAQQMIDEYKVAGIAPAQVFAQSFNLTDVLYWIEKEPAFGAQAVYLDNRVDQSGGVALATAGMTQLAAKGVKIVAPPIWALLELTEGKRIQPSEYAKAARKAGLDIITWTLERDRSLATGGGYYHQSIQAAVDNDGDTFKVLDVLARDVGVKGVFSDWPATTTFYANCTGR